ncbi:hypothetical protein ACP70R_041234 [Stipagrostis hirtigluma subsp. patula]
MSGAAGDELAELLWDNGPGLRRAPPPFQPFTCSAAGSSRAHELKRHADAKPGALVGVTSVPAGMHDAGLGGLPAQEDDDVVPWLHCPVIDDGDSDTAPLPPEYCAGLLPGYSVHPAAPAPAAATAGIERPSSHGAVVVPTTRAVPPETAATQPQPTAAGGGEGVMNFTFFSRPLQRPQASTAAASPSYPVESTVVQTAASRLRSTPLFSEQRMAWLQPPKGSRATAAAAPAAPPPPDRHGLQPEARPPDAAAATSSVCSGNGDRSLSKRSSHQPAECSFSPDEDIDDEGGATRRSAGRSTKRTRTAEVHNLSERRRRDRINEKMRALQELIPNCNKVDKASMLEEAIEYLKTLQLQVQMMSMGTGLCVPPMLLPAAVAMQQHLQMPPMAHFPHLGMGLGFGMGAPAFDMFAVPRVAAAGAQFPCPAMPGGAPPMAMPSPGAAMFGVPAQAMPSPAATFPHMVHPAPAEPMGASAPGGADAGDDQPVPVAPQVAATTQHHAMRVMASLICFHPRLLINAAILLLLQGGHPKQS